MRIYDPRVAKFLSVDPLTKEYPFYSPYQFASNSPILAVDIDGLESSNISNETEKPKDPLWSRIFQTLLGTSDEGAKFRDGVYKAGEDAVIGAYDFVRRDAYKFSTYKEGALNTYSLLTAVSPEVQASADAYTSLFGVNFNIQGRGNAFRQGLDVSNWDAERWGYATGSLSIGLATPPVTKALGGFALGKLGAGGSFAFNRLANLVTDKEGFLFGGITIKSPFSIGVQRFGNINLNRPDYWGLRIGESAFANRTFAAIKTEWNPLSVYTSGVIPKGTRMKVGIIGPQSGGFYLGGSLQFIVDSKSVLNQTTKLIDR